MTGVRSGAVLQRALVAIATVLVTALGGAPAVASPPAPGTESTLPFRADWSRGLSGWGGSDDWSAAGGMLVSDGSGYGERASMIAPLELGAGDGIAIEAEIRLDRYADEGRFGGRASFGVAARVQKNGEGYGAGHCYSLGRYVPICAGGRHGEHRSVLWTAGSADVIDFGAFRPGDGWHTYRLELRGNRLTLLIDGAVAAGGQDNRYLMGSRVGLWSNRTAISVRSFTVTSI